jgi:ribosomal protein S26
MEAQTTTATIDTTPKYTPISKIIKAVKKTGSVTDAAKILDLSRNAIYDRFKRAKLSIDDFTDYSDDKGLSHEILQYRLAKALTDKHIKKMPGGSIILGICQLNDKIRDERGKNANGNTVLVNVIVSGNVKLSDRLAIGKPDDGMKVVSSVDNT